jgi:hypothetical protein
MFTLASRRRSRAAIVAVLTLAGVGCALLATGADPAMALCKYGGPNCVNPNPGPKYPTVQGEKIPDSGWVDPDCKYYGNCQSPYSARRVPGGKVLPGKLQSR